MLAGRCAQVELHRDDGRPSGERRREAGVVTLGVSAGSCPGPCCGENATNVSYAVWVGLFEACESERILVKWAQ